jgi:hypothetical protein
MDRNRIATRRKIGVFHMDEIDKPDPMPRGPTDNIFMALGAFGALAVVVGVGLIVAASLGLLH